MIRNAIAFGKSLAKRLYSGVVDGDFSPVDGSLPQDKVAIEFFGCIPDGDDVVLRVRSLLSGDAPQAAVHITARDAKGGQVPAQVVNRGAVYHSDDSDYGCPCWEMLASVRLSRSSIPARIVVSDVSGRLKDGMRVLNGHRAGRLLKGFEHWTMDASRDPQYEVWFEQKRASDEEIERQRSSRLSCEPLISIVVCQNAHDAKGFVGTVESICSQSYANWELVVVVESRKGGQAEEAALARVDNRIKVVSSDSEVSGAAVLVGLQAASGEYAIVMEQGDVLEPNAFYECAHLFNDAPGADALYCDSDTVDSDGHHSRCDLKADFNKELLYARDYLARFLLAKRSLAVEAASVTLGDPAVGYARALEVAENATFIAHMPCVLHHRRFDPRRVTALQKRNALNAHFERHGIRAQAECEGVGGARTVRFVPEGMPKVSIVIPSKDHVDDLSRCLESVKRCAGYENYEIVIVENNSVEEATFAYYERIQEDERIRVVKFEGSFNYSSVMNFGVNASTGEYLLLLNNDTEAITPEFLAQLVGSAQREGVGVTGALLLYFDGLVQHAGVVIGVYDEPYHVMTDVPPFFDGRFNHIGCLQEYSAVTGACQMVKRAVYDEVGGYDESLAVCYNDVDFCLKVRKAGYRVVYDPAVVLHHGEFTSRGRDASEASKARFRDEYKVLRERWPEYFDADPFFNVNLNRESAYYSL